MKQIIIVDDDAINNFVCESMIHNQMKDVQVLSFVNPNKALDYLTAHQTDFDGLVIVDVNMPEMTGWQFIEKMNENKITAPIIMLTSSISYQDKESAHEFEMIKELFVKPMDTGMIKKISTFIK